MGSDQPRLTKLVNDEVFLSTLPAWGATPRSPVPYLRPWNISIHAPRVGSDLPQPFVVLFFHRISIHAPRVGSDGLATDSYAATVDFYPRSPRGERLGDLHPLWYRLDNFYPRSPRGERPALYRVD